MGSEFRYNAARSRVMHLDFDAMNAAVPSHDTPSMSGGLSCSAILKIAPSGPSCEKSPHDSLDRTGMSVGPAARQPHQCAPRPPSENIKTLLTPSDPPDGFHCDHNSVDNFNSIVRRRLDRGLVCPQAFLSGWAKSFCEAKAHLPRPLRRSRQSGSFMISGLPPQKDPPAFGRAILSRLAPTASALRANTKHPMLLHEGRNERKALLTLSADLQAENG